jgi:hypothetical protein
MGGAIVAVVLVEVINVVYYSPISRLKEASGIALPSGVRFVWQEGEHDDFLQQGYTFRAFSVPASTTTLLLEKCPTGFVKTRVGASGLWSMLQELRWRSDASACVKRIESKYYEDIVVIASARMYHMHIDR